MVTFYLVIYVIKLKGMEANGLIRVWSQLHGPGG